MDYKRLDEKAKKCWRIGRGIAFGIAVLVTVLMGLISRSVGFSRLADGIIFGLLGVSLVFLGLSLFAYPAIEYRQWKYLITEDRVEIVHGIFFIQKVIIPIIRIQNIRVSQGPIARKLELYDVNISIASDNFDIPCLGKETADQISTYLKERIYARLKSQEEK